MMPVAVYSRAYWCGGYWWLGLVYASLYVELTSGQMQSAFTNTAVKRNAHVRDLRKRGKNKGKLYTKECGLNKNTKYKKTPENIR